MKLEDVLKKCIEVPEVSFQTVSDRTELILEGAEGRGRMTFYPMFPGILLAYIHINAPAWPVPAMPEKAGAGGMLLLNYCVTGRCELLLNDNVYVYVKDDELSLSEHYAQERYIYPRRIYEGLELFLDPNIVKEEAAFFETAFQLDIAHIAEKYCSEGRTYIAACGHEIKETFLRIWSLYEDTSPAAAFERKAAVLRALGLLVYRGDLPESSGRVFLTPTQADIAKNVERVITADLRQHHPARELAERFSVSETSLKRYFRGVFGQNLSDYLLDVRMSTAARRLQAGTGSVAEIAESVGYLNQSKFSAAFKRRFGMSPLEYKRVQRLAE